MVLWKLFTRKCTFFSMCLLSLVYISMVSKSWMYRQSNKLQDSRGDSSDSIHVKSTETDSSPEDSETKSLDTSELVLQVNLPKSRTSIAEIQKDILSRRTVLGTNANGLSSTNGSLRLRNIKAMVPSTSGSSKERHEKPSDKKDAVLYVFANNVWEETPDNTRTKDKQWEDIEERQAWRRNALHSKCKELGLLNTTSSLTYEQFEILEYFAIDHTHKVILKSIPKTGCTSWYSLLIKNSPTMSYKNDTQTLVKDFNPFHWHLYRSYGLSLLKRLSRPTKISMLETYFTILTVRHPFVRLESYFKDKVLKAPKLQLIDVRESDKIKKRFQDFLGSILVEHAENRHWRTMYNSSFPCQIDYKYIGKTETSESDMTYIHQVKLSAVGDLEHRNPTNKINAQQEVVHTRQDGGYYLPYFSSLSNPEDTIAVLLSMYDVDMQLFGYELVVENGQYYATCSSFKRFGSCW